MGTERPCSDHDHVRGGAKERDDEPIRGIATADQGGGSLHIGDRDDPVDRRHEVAVHHPRSEAEGSVRSLHGFRKIESWQTGDFEERLELG